MVLTLQRYVKRDVSLVCFDCEVGHKRGRMSLLFQDVLDKSDVKFQRHSKRHIFLEIFFCGCDSFHLKNEIPGIETFIWCDCARSNL